MSSKYLYIIGLLANVCLVFSSCGEKSYGGEDMINYPDLTKVFNQEVDTESPLNYLHIHQEGTQVDSSDMPYDQIPWQEIQDLFADASLHKESLDKKYSISVLTDTLTDTRTMYYEALAPDIPTRSLSITSTMADNDIQNIYFDFNETGIMSSRNARVLLIPNQLIQIQKRAQKETVVDTYLYPQSKATSD